MGIAIGLEIGLSNEMVFILGIGLELHYGLRFRLGMGLVSVLGQGLKLTLSL